LPPPTHRLDKIYINGHSGEIKIGDLGLAVLAPRRFAPGVMPEGDPSDQYTRSVDIFAYGLLMLELITGRRVDKGGDLAWQERLEGVQDEAARAFIARCLDPPQQRPTARALLEDPFLQPPRKQPAAAGGAGGGSTGGAASSADQELMKSKSDAQQQNSMVRGGGVLGNCSPHGTVHNLAAEQSRAACNSVWPGGRGAWLQLQGCMLHALLKCAALTYV
jgi:WNK lysine deficient protein kinase